MKSFIVTISVIQISLSRILIGVAFISMFFREVILMSNPHQLSSSAEKNIYKRAFDSPVNERTDKKRRNPRTNKSVLGYSHDCLDGEFFHPVLKTCISCNDVCKSSSSNSAHDMSFCMNNCPGYKAPENRATSSSTPNNPKPRSDEIFVFNSDGKPVYVYKSGDFNPPPPTRATTTKAAEAVGMERFVDKPLFWTTIVSLVIAVSSMTTIVILCIQRRRAAVLAMHHAASRRRRPRRRILRWRGRSGDGKKDTGNKRNENSAVETLVEAEVDHTDEQRCQMLNGSSYNDGAPNSGLLSYRVSASSSLSPTRPSRARSKPKPHSADSGVLVTGWSIPPNQAVKRSETQSSGLVDNNLHAAPQFCGNMVPRNKDTTALPSKPSNIQTEASDHVTRVIQTSSQTKPHVAEISQQSIESKGNFDKVECISSDVLTPNIDVASCNYETSLPDDVGVSYHSSTSRENQNLNVNGKKVQINTLEHIDSILKTNDEIAQNTLDPSTELACVENNVENFNKLVKKAAEDYETFLPKNTETFNPTASLLKDKNLCLSDCVLKTDSVVPNETQEKVGSRLSSLGVLLNINRNQKLNLNKVDVSLNNDNVSSNVLDGNTLNYKENVEDTGNKDDIRAVNTLTGPVQASLLNSWYIPASRGVVEEVSVQNHNEDIYKQIQPLVSVHNSTSGRLNADRESNDIYNYTAISVRRMTNLDKSPETGINRQEIYSIPINNGVMLIPGEELSRRDAETAVIQPQECENLKPLELTVRKGTFFNVQHENDTGIRRTTQNIPPPVNTGLHSLSNS